MLMPTPMRHFTSDKDASRPYEPKSMKTAKNRLRLSQIITRWGLGLSAMVTCIACIIYI